MSITYYTADYIATGKGEVLKQGAVGISPQGVVTQILSSADSIPKDRVKLNGILTPGLINAHCHLELSHLKGVIPKETGLVDFLLSVMKLKSSDNKEQEKAAIAADKAMYKKGIQVVGDHVNTSITADIKKSSPIHYHTFVEVIGLKDDEIQEKIDIAKDIEFYFEEGKTSITPHAFYSCSKELIRNFKNHVGEDNILSIHNQESDEENKLFRYKKGDFLRFYKEIGFDVNKFRANSKNSFQTALPLLPNNEKTLFVHNTFTTLADISLLERLGKTGFFCFCPNANLYIEGTIPNVPVLHYGNQKIVLGTDSLASNDDLCLVSEMRAIQQRYPEITFKDLISWATTNGAEFFGLDSELGSLEIGKRPGLVLLKNMNDLAFTDDSTSERVV